MDSEVNIWKYKMDRILLIGELNDFNKRSGIIQQSVTIDVLNWRRRGWTRIHYAIDLWGTSVHSDSLI